MRGCENLRELAQGLGSSSLVERLVVLLCRTGPGFNCVPRGPNQGNPSFALCHCAIGVVFALGDFSLLCSQPGKLPLAFGPR